MLILLYISSRQTHCWFLPQLVCMHKWCRLPCYSLTPNPILTFLRAWSTSTCPCPVRSALVPSVFMTYSCHNYLAMISLKSPNLSLSFNLTGVGGVQRWPTGKLSILHSNHRSQGREIPWHPILTAKGYRVIVYWCGGTSQWINLEMWYSLVLLTGISYIWGQALTVSRGGITGCKQCITYRPLTLSVHGARNWHWQQRGTITACGSELHSHKGEQGGGETCFWVIYMPSLGSVDLYTLLLYICMSIYQHRFVFIRRAHI